MTFPRGRVGTGAAWPPRLPELHILVLLRRRAQHPPHQLVALAAVIVVIAGHHDTPSDG
jgi:hypothetical protein